MLRSRACRPDRVLRRHTATVNNGLSLCAIHHRAFDQHLVAVTPDYAVEVSARLLEDEDGPMRELLKGFDGTTIVVPNRRSDRPDPDRLALRYERFVRAAAG